MRGLPRVLLLFHNKFNKLNNTGVRMEDSIYHYDIKIIKKSQVWHENL